MRAARSAASGVTPSQLGEISSSGLCGPASAPITSVPAHSSAPLA